MKEDIVFLRTEKRLICYTCMGKLSHFSELMRANKFNGTCKYCQKRRPVIALDVIYDSLLDAIRYEYDNPENGLGYMDGEWVEVGNQIIDAHDLLNDEFDFGASACFQDIVNYFYAENYLWCKKEFYDYSDSERMIYSWKYFCEHIKSKNGIFTPEDAVSGDYENETFRAKDALAAIDASITCLNLINVLKPGTILYRARGYKGNRYNLAKDLGTPEAVKAKNANRFNEAGKPAFYASDRVDTCMLELEDRQNFIISKWRTREEMLIIDIPSEFNFFNRKHFYKHYPSLLDVKRRHLRSMADFFSSFANDISTPIYKDGNQHIEYIPTQIISQRIKNMVHPQSGKPIDGICFRSSKNGKKNYVLFVRNDQCCDLGGSGRIELVSTRLKKNTIDHQNIQAIINKII